MKTILALIDFSDVSPKILDHAESLARAFGSEVVLIHVVPPEPLVVDFEPPAIPPNLFLERQAELAALRDTLLGRGIRAKSQLLGGLLLETLLEQIVLLDPDVIIMGTHGHGALYHLIVGSVTEGILKQAQRPVVIIPSVPAPETFLVKAATKKARRENPGGTIGALGGIASPV